MKISPLFCRNCDTHVSIHGERAFCECKSVDYLLTNNIYSSTDVKPKTDESIVRDRQSKGYLSHSKFPTQIGSFKKWLEKLPPPKSGEVALDLGCGPGPYTTMLLDKGYSVIAIDFSVECLHINYTSCLDHKHKELVAIKLVKN